MSFVDKHSHELIRELLRSKGIAQAKAARSIRCDERTMRRYLEGPLPIAAERLLDLLKLVGIDVEASLRDQLGLVQLSDRNESKADALARDFKDTFEKLSPRDQRGLKHALMPYKTIVKQNAIVAQSRSTQL